MQSNLKMWHLVLMALVFIGYNAVTVYLYLQMNGGIMFDYMILGYDQAAYRHNLYLMGENGLFVYKYQFFILDTGYPLIYCTTGMIAWEMLVKARNAKLYWLGGLLMVAGAFLDYGENARIALILFDIIDPSKDVIAATSKFTVAKWMVLGIFAASLALFTVFRWQERRKIKSNG